MILFLAVSLSAEVKVYLFPTAAAGREGIRVPGIGRIEGPAEVIESICAAPIDRRLYRDGFIGRRELRDYLAERTTEPVIIYGNGVIIVPEKGEGDGVKKDEARDIRSGDSIILAITRKGIRIEVECVATGDGSPGDTIPVRLRNNRIMKGKVISKRLAECSI